MPSWMRVAAPLPSAPATLLVRSRQPFMSSSPKFTLETGLQIRLACIVSSEFVVPDTTTAPSWLTLYSFCWWP